MKKMGRFSILGLTYFHTCTTFDCYICNTIYQRGAERYVSAAFYGDIRPNRHELVGGTCVFVSEREFHIFYGNSSCALRAINVIVAGISDAVPISVELVGEDIHQTRGN